MIDSSSLENQELPHYLKGVAGKVYPNYPLGKISFFKTGGCADYLFLPSSVADLQLFLAACPPEVPIFVLGAASNLLVRDGGIRGVVVKLNAFNSLQQDEHNPLLVHAGAGVNDKMIAMFAQQKGIAGLEFLYTIPGSIGGAAVMNAGAHGRELKDCFCEAKTLDRHGTIGCVSAADMQFGYRTSRFSTLDSAAANHDLNPEVAKRWLVITQVSVQGSGLADPQVLLEKTKQLEAERVQSQPLARERTAGSTFKNPTPYKAWQLIKAAGCENLSVGGARVSAKHCNFLINEGKATASDIESLGQEIQARVYANSGIQLEWEIKIVGEHQS